MYYDKAIELDPNYVEAYMCRGVLKASSGFPKDAMTDFDEVRRIDPLHPHVDEARELAGGMLDAISRLDDSFGVSANLNRPVAQSFHEFAQNLSDDQDRAMEETPSVAYLARGALAYFNGDHSDALSCLDKSIESDPNHGEAHALRCQVKAVLGDYQGAISDSDKAIDLKGDDSDYAEALAQVYSCRAKAKMALGQFEEAHVDCNEAISRKSDDAESYLCRMTLNSLLFQRLLTVAKKLGKESNEAKHAVLLALRRKDEIQADLERAHQLAEQSQDDALLEKIYVVTRELTSQLDAIEMTEADN